MMHTSHGICKEERERVAVVWRWWWNGKKDTSRKLVHRMIDLAAAQHQLSMF
jgi:hypothetical protein